MASIKYFPINKSVLYYIGVTFLFTKEFEYKQKTFRASLLRLAKEFDYLLNEDSVGNVINSAVSVS